MSPARMAKLEAAMRVVLKLNEAFNRHDVSGIMQLMSDDCIFESTHPAPEGTIYSGKEAITQFWQDFFQKSPQAHIQIEDIFSLGERCIMRWKYSWGDTDRQMRYIRGVDLFRVRNGLICEKLSYIKG